MEIGSLSRSLDKNILFQWKPSTQNLECCVFPCKIAGWTTGARFRKLLYSGVASLQKYRDGNLISKKFSVPIGAEESSLTEYGDYSDVDENSLEDAPEDPLSRPLTSDELKALLIDSERSKLVKKLSEANQQNRFLKRQLKTQKDELDNFKSELAVMELEVQALVKLAKEIVNLNIPEGSRKINGKYIQSHVVSRLEALQEKLEEQIKDVEAARPKEVYLSWYGMAENVQVMGTFDGWSDGENLSAEYTGSYTRFSATLMLRPGRYEIKFLVDGEWQLSPEFPTVGEGMTENNLLVVE